MIAVPNESGNGGREALDQRVLNHSCVLGSGSTGLGGGPDVWNHKANTVVVASGSVAKNVGDHVGNLVVYYASSRSVFPGFNYVASGIFDFQNIGDIFEGTTTSKGCVGIGMLHHADATT